jgi:hypothetical protein
VGHRAGLAPVGPGAHHDDLTDPPTIRVRVGAPVRLGLEDAVADSAAIMEAIVALLPDEAARWAEPTDEEMARTFPPGHRLREPGDGSPRRLGPPASARPGPGPAWPLAR